MKPLLTLSPIPDDDLPAILASERRARAFGELSRTVLSNTGLETYEGTIHSRPLKNDVEQELVNLMATLGAVRQQSLETVEYESLALKQVVHEALAGIFASETPASRIAWMNSALVQAHRAYEEREQARLQADPPEETLALA